ncbi:hypothetical protein JYT23_00745 [Mariprofundus ferrooxydans]|nr:hypothetical protein [Mariprofundus ferrooxydans]
MNIYAIITERKMSGAVLLRSGSIAIRSEGVLLARIKPGDIFGEVALVNGQA